MKLDFNIQFSFTIIYISHLHYSFGWNVLLPPIDFVEQFSKTHDKAFVVTYLPNEGDNFQEIITHSRMLVKNLYTYCWYLLGIR